MLQAWCLSLPALLSYAYKRNQGTCTAYRCKLQQGFPCRQRNTGSLAWACFPAGASGQCTLLDRSGKPLQYPAVWLAHVMPAYVRCTHNAALQSHVHMSAHSLACAGFLRSCQSLAELWAQVSLRINLSQCSAYYDCGHVAVVFH